jgi:hypothetical protein
MKSVKYGEMWESARRFFERTAIAFESRDEPGQWVCFDFQEMRVQLTSYAITRGLTCMVSWVLEVSMDGQNWTEIDRRANVLSRHPARDTERNDVANCPQGRFVRLTQTEPNDRGKHVMHLVELELFGTLFEYRE